VWAVLTLMKKLLVFGAMSCVMVATASATITPFSFYAGYFRGNSFNNSAGNSVHISGFELGAQQSLVNLPLVGQVDLGASVAFGGSLRDSGSVNGTLYRIYAQYKTPTAGPNSLYGIGGFGYYIATGGGFDRQSGLGSEIGVGLPIKAPVPGVPGAALEARYRFGSKAATKGFSIGLSVSF
jgi:hypothetical protein